MPAPSAPVPTRPPALGLHSSASWASPTEPQGSRPCVQCLGGLCADSGRPTACPQVAAEAQLSCTADALSCPGGLLTRTWVPGPESMIKIIYEVLGVTEQQLLTTGCQVCTPPGAHGAALPSPLGHSSVPELLPWKLGLTPACPKLFILCTTQLPGLLVPTP